MTGLAAGTSLPPSRRIDLTQDAAGLPLKPEYRRGFEYSDCSVDDSRLVILNAVDAAERGASMNPQTRCVSAEAQDGGWRLRVQNVQTEEVQQIRARILVNATGPWINQVLQSLLKIEPPLKVRLDKGSHIVVRRRFAQDRAYLFQNADRRVVFAIPLQSDFTLFGTTEENYRGDPAAAAISENEIEYLLRSVNAYCRVPVSRDEIVWSYSGVRALPKPSGAAATQSRKLSREYVLTLTTEAGAPLLNVYGGKITTYRTLAEAVLRRLSPFLPMTSPWTGNVPLPGGDIAGRIEDFITACAGKYPFLDSATLRRLVCAYGTRINAVLGEARGAAELGKSFGGRLSEAELRYLVDREWAKTADNVLWRRTKLGLKLDHTGKMEVEAWFRDMPASAEADAGNRKQQ